MGPPPSPLAAGLLLAALLFPGLSGAHALGHAGIEPPRIPQEASSQRGANGSLLHHQMKRYLPPRTPPYPEPEPDFKIVSCQRSEEHCQEFCNFMEIQVGYCSKKKDPCCMHRACCQP
ncbi:sperm-associated antigen 11B [Fukomys damarensis]|uniref:Sperm-associated antigen 11 n=1 Tax=Fukomys damarensis TaxID=885580 RepID=A0A091E5P0_FUKDA|nr:sperm-associated antigen 11B [Fukomys damarensis]KFO38048.1 hypothetical protein H920_00443 [Fukomys damarensis]